MYCRRRKGVKFVQFGRWLSQRTQRSRGNSWHIATPTSSFNKRTAGTVTTAAPPWFAARVSVRVHGRGRSTSTRVLEQHGSCRCSALSTTAAAQSCYTHTHTHTHGRTYGTAHYYIPPHLLRRYNNLEPIGTESAETEGVGVMPCFNDKSIDRSRRTSSRSINLLATEQMWQPNTSVLPAVVERRFDVYPTTDWQRSLHISMRSGSVTIHNCNTISCITRTSGTATAVSTL